MTAGTSTAASQQRIGGNFRSGAGKTSRIFRSAAADKSAPSLTEIAPDFEADTDDDALKIGSLAPLPQDEHASRRSLDGVILEVSRDSVAISCKLPNAWERLVLPRELVSQELQQYGAAVTISLNETAGIRAPTVSARTVDPSADNDPEDAELLAWIDKL